VAAHHFSMTAHPGSTQPPRRYPQPKRRDETDPRSSTEKRAKSVIGAMRGMNSVEVRSRKIRQLLQRRVKQWTGPTMTRTVRQLKTINPSRGPALDQARRVAINALSKGKGREEVLREIEAALGDSGKVSWRADVAKQMFDEGESAIRRGVSSSFARSLRPVTRGNASVASAAGKLAEQGYELLRPVLRGAVKVGKVIKVIGRFNPALDIAYAGLTAHEAYLAWSNDHSFEDKARLTSSAAMLTGSAALGTAAAVSALTAASISCAWFPPAAGVLAAAAFGIYYEKEIRKGAKWAARKFEKTPELAIAFAGPTGLALASAYRHRKSLARLGSAAQAATTEVAGKLGKAAHQAIDVVENAAPWKW
jgi:hypothetical protein